MPRLYPDGSRAVALDGATRAGAAPTMPTIPGGGSSITTPPEQDFNTPAMAGSMQQFLSENLGEYVVVEFLIGTASTIQKEGILYAVGTSVMTLFEERTGTFVMCDIFSVKFVTFYPYGSRPWQMSNPDARYSEGGMASGMGNMGGMSAGAGTGMGGCSNPDCGASRMLGQR